MGKDQQQPTTAGKQIETLEQARQRLQSAHDEVVAENRRLNESNRELAADLIRLQRLEDLGRMTRCLAHDFNNLLGIVLGHGDLLLRRLGPDDPLRLHADEIVRAADLMVEKVGKLHDLGAPGPRNRRRCLDLCAAIENLRSTLESVVGEAVALRVHCHAERRTVFADPAQVEQVLLNLATNARQAMPEGGALTICLRNPRARDDDEAPDELIIEVSDTGCGMDEDTRARAFEPFFANGDAGGAGLGLPTVAAVVEECGGRVELAAAEAGTTVLVHWPLHDPLATPCEPPADAPYGGNETVLLVDDEDGVRNYMANVLTVNGYTVIEAANAHEALLASDEYGGHIHLLLTDVVMPRMSGFQLAEQFRRVRPDTPMLFVSAWQDEGSVRELIGPDCTFLRKPVRPEQLMREVRRVLDAAE